MMSNNQMIMSLKEYNPICSCHMKKLRNPPNSLCYFDPQNLSHNKYETVRQQMFAPPIEIIYKGNFHSACREARNLNKWLLVSVHNNENFKCHLLNIGLWKYPPMIQLIKENFVFWPVLCHSIEANDFNKSYTYDPQNPHIAILDPKSGENKIQFNGNGIATNDVMVKYFEEFVITNQISSLKFIINDPIGIVKEYSSPTSTGSRKEGAENCKYNPENGDGKITILVKAKDNRREKIILPLKSQCKVLWLILREKGFQMDNVKLLRTFEKLIIDEKMWNETLEFCGMKNMDTFHLVDV